MQREKLDLELIWVTHRAVSIWRYQEQVLAQALGDFMLLSAFKKGQDQWQLLRHGACPPRGKHGEDLVASVYGAPVNIDGLVFLRFQILTSQNL